MQDNKTTIQAVFLCRHCGNETSHKQICHHSIDEVIETTYDAKFNKIDITVSEYYFLFECLTCSGISLKEVFSESLDIDEPIDFTKINYLYPVSKDLLHQVPKGLLMIINEASRVKSVSQLAYVILVRKILEEICREKGIRGKNLKEQLEELVESEALPPVFKEATDKLRLFGNIGAHASKINLNKDSVKLIEEFMYALVEFIYILPNKLKKLDDALITQKGN